MANEALACGRPIIVSDAVGCGPDLAADGVVGRTFPVGNYRRLAEQIGAELDEPPALAAIHRLSQAYSIDVACEGITKALEFVMVRRAKQSAIA